MEFLFIVGGIFFLIFLFGAKSGSKSNYRKNGLSNATKDKYGNIQDAYTGKYHKAKNMDADHIYPKSLGGSNANYNIAMTHKTINRSKGNKIQPNRMVQGYAKNQNIKKSTKAAVAASSLIAAASTLID